MRKYNYQVEDFVKSIDLELSNIMRKMQNANFEQILIEIDPRTKLFSMASIHVWDDQYLYEAEISPEGDLTVRQQMEVAV